MHIHCVQILVLLTQKYMLREERAFLLFNTFPSGLNLYYAVYNILNYIQQKSIKSTT